MAGSGTWPRAGAVCLALAVIGGACASPRAEGSKGEIVIASDFPTSGPIGGVAGAAGVAYAIEVTGSIKGFTLVHRGYDDAVNGVQDPKKGAENFGEMANDPTVLGVIGPFNSNVARATIPVANKAELVMISPSNTATCLTIDHPTCDPKPAAVRDASKPNNYFRIVAPDPMQGYAMADFARDALKVTKAAVLSDSLPFGKITADSFTKRFEGKGGTVVAREDYAPFASPKDFKPFLQRARDGGAQAIYVGGTTATGTCVVRAQGKGILDVPFLATDGSGDGQCIKDAGDQASDAMYFTVASPVASQDPANAALIDAFTKAHPQKRDLGAYTFLGYDAAKVLIDALGRAIDAAGGKLPTRRQVLDAVQSTKNLKVSSGTYSFDRSGDATSPVMALYQVKNGAWTFARQFAVGP